MGVLVASWGPHGGLFGVSLGPLWDLCGLLGGSRGVLGGLEGLLRVKGPQEPPKRPPKNPPSTSLGCPFSGRFVPQSTPDRQLREGRQAKTRFSQNLHGASAGGTFWSLRVGPIGGKKRLQGVPKSLAQAFGDLLKTPTKYLPKPAPPTPSPDAPS